MRIYYPSDPECRNDPVPPPTKFHKCAGCGRKTFASYRLCFDCDKEEFEAKETLARLKKGRGR